MFVIGGLVMDWRISHGFAGWSEIGRELAPDWQHSYSIYECSSRIGIGLTLNWQIGLGLTKLPGIIGLVSDL